MSSEQLARLGMNRAAAVKYKSEESQDYRRYEAFAATVFIVFCFVIGSLLYGSYLG